MSVLSLIHLFPFARIVIKQYIEWMIPDPFKYEMKKNPPKQVEEQEQKPAFQFVPNLSDDELRLLTREKLSAALQAIDPVEQPGMTKALCAEMKDRLDGKPGQQVTIDQNLNVVTVNAQISFVKAQPIVESGTLVIENTGNQ